MTSPALTAGLTTALMGDPADLVMPLLGDVIEEDWPELALCAQTDPDAFFPEKGGSTREPKRICQGCPVRVECLEYALDHDERFGVWGGLSERERRPLRKAIRRPGHPRGKANP